MPTIKLTDDEASDLFSQQIGKKHPFTIVHQDILIEQVYQSVLYSKQNKGVWMPVILRLKIEFPYFLPRLNRHFNIHFYIRAIIDYSWNKRDKGDEIRRTYYTADFYLRTWDIFDAETEKPYVFRLKNAFDVPNFSAKPTIYSRADGLGYFLRYRLPQISENLIHFIDQDQLHARLCLDIERPIRQRIAAR